MSQQTYYLIAILLIVVAAILIWNYNRPAEIPSNLDTILSAQQANEQKVSKQNMVCLKGSCFEVELAINGQQRATGLMNREELGQDKGMLFIFNRPGPYGFWMKNTLIALDIIWIDQDYKVVHIAADTQPCQSGKSCPVTSPEQSALYVLEVNAGIAKQLDLATGDIVQFNLSN